ncbi:MAG TPA: hypothetical protein VGN34_18370 [Ktedonobacteraceae bacterium]
MMPTINEQAPVPPPAYHRMQARLGPALHIDTLTLVTHFASAHALSSGCTHGTSLVPTTFARRSGRCTMNL